MFWRSDALPRVVARRAHDTNSRIHRHLSEVRFPQDGADAQGRLRFLLGLSAMWRAPETKARRLLRFLLLRHGEMSAGADRWRLPQVRRTEQFTPYRHESIRTIRTTSATTSSTPTIHQMNIPVIIRPPCSIRSGVAECNGFSLSAFRAAIVQFAD
jgi:hypothetical protein